MKKQVLVFLLFSLFAHSQQKVFKFPMNINSLSAEKRISDDLNSTYKSTFYYTQNGFDLKQDLDINLPNNSIIKAIYERSISYSIGSYSAIYKIKNDMNGELVLSAYDNVITGMYVSGENDKFVIQQTADNVFAVSEVNSVSFNDKEELIDYQIETQDKSENDALINNDVCLSTTPVCSGMTRIDLMVVYTAGASSFWGGNATANSTITSAVTNMNVALINSGITNITFNLVYTGVINYVETGVFQTDLNSLKSSTDGIIDEVHTLRAAYGADLVGLILSSPTSSCGLGNLNTLSANYVNTQAFVVNLYSCILSNYSLAHEFGHNMGLNHDWYVNQSISPCSHHHGYVNKTAVNNASASTIAQRWRTIMSYNDECSDVGINCTRINRWANPAVTYNSESTGIAIGLANPSDEAFGFRRFACVVSGFMPTVLDTNDFNQALFTVFPNPIKNTLTINSYFEISQTAIFNSIGQLVLKSNQKSIDTESLSAGIYFVKVYGEEGKIVGVKKVIKE